MTSILQDPNDPNQQRRQQQQPGMQLQPQGQPQGQGMTFSQMQQRGFARPAPPNPQIPSNFVGPNQQVLNRGAGSPPPGGGAPMGPPPANDTMTGMPRQQGFGTYVPGMVLTEHMNGLGGQQSGSNGGGDSTPIGNRRGYFRPRQPNPGNPMEGDAPRGDRVADETGMVGGGGPSGSMGSGDPFGWMGSGDPKGSMGSGEPFGSMGGGGGGQLGGGGWGGWGGGGGFFDSMGGGGPFGSMGSGGGNQNLPPGGGDPMINQYLRNQLMSGGFQQPQGQYGLSSNPVLQDQINGQAQNFQGYNNPMQGQQEALLQQMLSNPSAYTTDMFKNNLSQANQALDEQYGLDQNHLNEQMAKRGMYNSTMAVGQLGDLGVQHERTKANLAQNLLTQMAQGYQADRASAFGAGNAYANQGLNSFLGNQAAMGDAINRATGYQNTRDQLGMQYDQNQFGNALQGYNANEATRQGRLSQAMGYDNDIFNRSYQTNQLNNQNDQQMMQLYLRMMGL